ncbi:hypothetical protein [Novosphingobium mangrovi (ex Huang et al. 2023)]|uniref:Uncharacterized protein n=1 Tax=Novosphingobium mangrovi (ex Huang et al. 2023) TaxID=2976432 RepID=A0ABT2I1N3_9SPHN|nr:hypothetical protein [Novosphingobium mangrovi (ex Huang et al. 2023)]MCT2398711.1 hypothetical protein [Novosphingobium mangrovi (ex Huang et al. 2023)]
MAGFLLAGGIYLTGWLVTAWCFAGIQGPVPVPGRFRRDVRDALFWPIWLVLYAVFWVVELRRQAFEEDFAGADRS